MTAIPSPLATPANLGDIVAWSILITPGWVAMQIYQSIVLPQRHKPRPDYMHLIPMLAFSTAAYELAVGLARVTHPTGWQSNITISAGNWLFVASIFGFAGLLGLATGLLRRATSSSRADVWSHIWDCPDGAPYVLVRLKDGGVAYGAVCAFSADPDDTERELWLCPVYDYDRSDPDSDPQEIPGLSIYLRGDQIATISAFRTPDPGRGKQRVATASDEPPGTA